MLAEAESSSAEKKANKNAETKEKDARDGHSSKSEEKKNAQPAFRAPRGGVDAGDHPPITPASAASSPADVGGVDAWRGEGGATVGWQAGPAALAASAVPHA